MKIPVHRKDVGELGVHNLPQHASVPSETPFDLLQRVWWLFLLGCHLERPLVVASPAAVATTTTVPTLSVLGWLEQLLVWTEVVLADTLDEILPGLASE